MFFFLVHTSETKKIMQRTVAEVEGLVCVGVRKVVSDDRVEGITEDDRNELWKVKLSHYVLWKGSQRP